MKNFSFIVLAISTILLCISCSSGKKALKQGNYEEAVFDALDRLKKAPNNNRALEALQNAYPALQEVYSSRINSLKASTSPMRWEELYDMYSTLDNVHNEVLRTPAAKNTIQSRSYAGELADVKVQIINSRFRLGKEELAKGYRENAKLAFGHFKRVYELDPQRSDAEDLMYEAQNKATLFVAFKPIPLHSQTFKISNDFFESQVLEYLRTRIDNPFIRFLDKNETQISGKPEHILEFAFDDFVVGQGYEKETVNQRTKDSIAVGTATVGDTTVTTYGTVKAEVHEFVRTISSSGLLNVNIIDGQNNAVLAQRKFPGTYEYTDRWGFYNGDERALTEEDKEVVKRKSRLPDPPPQDLFIEFTRPIYDQVTRYLRDFYADY